MEEVIADKEIQYDDEPDHSEVDNEEGRIDNSDTEQHISSDETCCAQKRSYAKEKQSSFTYTKITNTCAPQNVTETASFTYTKITNTITETPGRNY
ncbi:hypothetical protein QE152_g4329 [Popillia japonica]|uniref:Uncharacterized protein n=1 Tax=Popillia japonica TaxID=7064 RepID=A0AAW1N174_POPJA